MVIYSFTGICQREIKPHFGAPLTVLEEPGSTAATTETKTCILVLNLELMIAFKTKFSKRFELKTFKTILSWNRFSMPNPSHMFVIDCHDKSLNYIDTEPNYH